MNFVNSMFSAIMFFTTICFAQYEEYQVERQNPDIYRLEQEISKLEKVSSTLESMHNQITPLSRSVFDLYTTAKTNLQNNIYKMYFKGSLEIYNKVSAPLSSLLDVLNDAFLNLAVEPHLWKVQEREALIDNLNNSSYYRNTKLRMMYNSLGTIMAYGLERFDDDLTPIPYTSTWWGNPDNSPDDETEKVTRKLNILVNISDMVYKKTEEELSKMRDERRQVIETINTLKTELAAAKAKDEEEKRIAKETEDWMIRMRERAGISPNYEKPQVYQTNQYDPPEVIQKIAEVKAKDKQLREEDATRQAELERLKQLQKQKEADARVYIDADCPRHVFVNERASFMVRAYPEDIKGTFVLTVDDKEVARSKKETNSIEFGYVFKDIGKYDVQAKLFIGGNYNDTYTDQFYAEENPAIPTMPSFTPSTAKDDQPYDPSKEGKKELRVNLGYCQYSVLYQKGKVYLTGFYYTPSGQKIDYTSEPLAPHTAPIAETGLMLTKSGTGYHFYQTTGDTKQGSPFIITRMRGPEVKVINRFKAVSTQVKPATDLSTIIIEYKEIQNGPLKQIVLD